MERKEYFRYTKPLGEIELEYANKMNVVEKAGRASWLKDHGTYGFEMRIAGERMWFENDETTKLVKKYLKSGDQVSVKYFRDEHKDEIISFDNHTKNVSIGNKRLQTIWEYQKQVADVRENTYKILYPLLKDTGSVAMVLKKIGDRYDLVDIRAFDTHSLRGRFVNQFLADNHFEKVSVGDGYVLGYSEAILEDIPNSDCVLYICNQKVKRRDCQCGASRMSNRSLLIPEGYGSYEYLCAQCFFDKMKISVSEEFKKNFSAEKHIVRGADVLDDTCVKTIEAILGV